MIVDYLTQLICNDEWVMTGNANQLANPIE